MSVIGLTQTGDAGGAARDPAEAPLVGRGEQLTALRSALRRVERGDTAAVFVEGELGVGKSRLLAATAARFRATGALVLFGTCLDIGDASPLHPLRHALRRFTPEPASTTPGGCGGPTASTKVREVIAARDLMAMLDGEVLGPDGAGALLERISRGLGAVAAGRSLVLILDDLQWADRTTRQLLLYLLAGLGGIRLLLLGAVRTESLGGDGPLRAMLAELRRLRSVRMLRLPPLDRDDTADLAASVTGRPLAVAEADALWRRSGGVPFVVEELARDLRDGRTGLSETLREIFLARTDALPDDSRTVARAVAVGTEPVGHTLLARVLPLGEDALIQAVRTAVTQRILEAGEDGYRFRHHLVREVLGTQLLPEERIRLHRRYAEALAAGPTGELQHARLAYHWRAAGEPARALPAAVAAAREAERLHGFAEACEHWTSALDLIRHVPVDQRGGLGPTPLGRWAAEAAHRCGEHGRGLVLTDQLAAEPGDPPSWLRPLRARLLAAVGRLTEAEAEYESTLAAGDVSAPERVAAAAQAADLLRQLGRYADAGKRAQDALDRARGVPDCTSSVVLAGATLGYSQAFLDDHAAGVAALEEARHTARRAGSPLDVARADLHLAELLSGPLNELEKGVAVARRGAAGTERVGLSRTYGTRLLAVAANGLFRLGRWAEAEDVVETGLRHRPSGAEAVELLLARCRLRVGYGQLDASERDLEAVETLLAAGGGVRQLLPLLTLRAGIAMWRDRPAAAREAVRHGLDLAESRSDDVWLRAPLVWHGLRAEAEARNSRNGTPDAGAIRRLLGVAERMTENSSSAAAPVRGAVTAYRELCAAEISRLDGRSDPALWARTAGVWERLNHPYPAAYARLRQAEALFAVRTRNAEAAGALRSAYRTGRQLGAGPLTEEAVALAARARVTLDRPTARDATPAGPGGKHPGQDHLAQARPHHLALLTSRERQVLALVAEGRTNRSIAAELFISERTVGVHVSHIFGKLQVRTRVEATRIYDRDRPDP
jgi:DNA-binding CsgD family transcriptional regulator